MQRMVNYSEFPSYEQGNWDAVEQSAKQCGIPLPAAGEAYLDSTDWAKEIIQLTGSV